MEQKAANEIPRHAREQKYVCATFDICHSVLLRDCSYRWCTLSGRVGGRAYKKKTSLDFTRTSQSHHRYVQKKRGWQCNNSWHSFPGCNARSENPLVGKADVSGTQLPYYRCMWHTSGITFAKLQQHTDRAGKLHTLPVARIFGRTDVVRHRIRLLAGQKLTGLPKCGTAAC